MKMKKVTCLIASGAFLLAMWAVSGSGAEPRAVIKKKALTAAAYKTSRKAPKVLKQDLTLTQALESIPPAPAAGEEGPSRAHEEWAPTPVPTSSRLEPLPDSYAGSYAGPIDSMQLYNRVEYEDLDNVHPCAITKIVAVPDPCEDPCNSCGPRCVYVQICVPPCECPDIKKSHSGNKVKYDYGRYEVEIKSKKGIVYVNYDKGLFDF